MIFWPNSPKICCLVILLNTNPHSFVPNRTHGTVCTAKIPPLPSPPFPSFSKTTGQHAAAENIANTPSSVRLFCVHNLEEREIMKRRRPNRERSAGMSGVEGRHLLILQAGWLHFIQSVRGQGVIRREITGQFSPISRRSRDPIQ